MSNTTRGRKLTCKICDKPFDRPSGLGASTKYCVEHRALDSHARRRLLDIKNGLAPKPQRYPQKRVRVDNTRTITIQSVVHWRVPLEKFLAVYYDKKVRFTG